MTGLLRYIVTAAAVLIIAGLASARYSGGTGLPNDPYRITSAEDLNDIGNHVEDFNSCFVLVNDINLASLAGPFNTIGDDSNAFGGVFDGNGHTITGFTYQLGWDMDVGLFGYVRGPNALIVNLVLEQPDVNASQAYFVGALVGTLEQGTLLNCAVLGGNVVGMHIVGALVGYNHDGTVYGCYADSNVTGTGPNGFLDVGGLVGTNAFGWIEQCFAAGSVQADSMTDVGGLVGYNSGLIRNCYAAGPVSGYDSVGGLLGYNFGTVENCYSIGPVAANPGQAGGLVGIESSGTTIDSFWDTQTSGRATSAGGTGLTTPEMQTKATFINAGWDLAGETVNGPNDTWTVSEGADYPKLLRTLIDSARPWFKIDFADYAGFSAYWGRSDCAAIGACDGADLNGDGAVDWQDLEIFCRFWLDGT